MIYLTARGFGIYISISLGVLAFGVIMNIIMGGPFLGEVDFFSALLYLLALYAGLHIAVLSVAWVVMCLAPKGVGNAVLLVLAIIGLIYCMYEFPIGKNAGVHIFVVFWFNLVLVCAWSFCSEILARKKGRQ